MAVIQPIPRVAAGVGYGSSLQYIGVNCGDGNAVNSFSKAPWPIDGTLRNLAVYGGGTRVGNLVVTVLVNGSPSALTATLSNTASQASNTSSISVAQGNYVEYKLAYVDPLSPEDPASESIPGVDIGLCLEFESTSHMAFGIVAQAGTVSNGDQAMAGALGNGSWSLAGSLSTTYSIAAIDATVTTLVLQRYNSPSGGSWVAQMRLNSVIQDGSGGTVDTTTTLLDSGGATVVGTFSLPIVATDHLDVLITRTDTGIAFSGAILGAGIGVTPTDPDQVMVCGGDGSVIPNAGTTWKWVQSRQEGPSEYMHTTVAGLRPFTYSGLIVERSVAPGGGASFTHTLKKSGSNTGLSVVLSGAATFGSTAGEVITHSGDLITLGVVNGGSPADSRLHFSFAIGPPATTDTDTDLPGGTIGPHAWMEWRRVEP